VIRNFGKVQRKDLQKSFPKGMFLILWDKLREEAGVCFKFNVKEELAEKKWGRNHDLMVMEYKIAKEAMLNRWIMKKQMNG
jgi:hypothetical protein